MSYQNTSRGYLARARERMAEDKPEFMIYAALELRSGIESRYQEYLAAWDHISDKAKKSWQLSQLGKDAANAFQTGDKVSQLIIRTEDNSETLAILYHTPVTKALRNRGERLGKYLHAIHDNSPSKDSFWTTLQKELYACAEELSLANRGTLLGPPLGRLVH